MTETNENTRDFKGIWIPKEIYLHPDLSWTEKLLYCEIDSLDGEEGCFASNDYFAKFLGVGEWTISNGIKKLKELGFISQQSFDGRKRVLKAELRKITEQGCEKSQGRVEKNHKHNNIDYNNSLIKENNINTKSIYIQRKDKKDDVMCLGEFKNVKLTKEQVKKLIINYDWYFEDAIETLSSYLESKGNRYKSHYAVLSKHNWVWNKVHQDPECGQRPVCLMVPDPTQKGGLRKETALEYYTKKYNLQF